MLKIRSEQAGSFKKRMYLLFENDMVDNLKRYYPDSCDVLGEPEVRKTVQYGYKKSQDYGFESRNEAGRYIYLIFAFGQNFDNDNNHHWASEVLNDDRILNPTDKMDVLYREAERHMDSAVPLHKNLKSLVSEMSY